MILKMMEAIGRKTDGKGPVAGDVFGFHFPDGVAIIQFNEGPNGTLIPQITVSSILESFDQNIYSSPKTEKN